MIIRHWKLIGFSLAVLLVVGIDATAFYGTDAYRYSEKFILNSPELKKSLGPIKHIFVVPFGHSSYQTRGAKGEADLDLYIVGETTSDYAHSFSKMEHGVWRMELFYFRQRNLLSQNP